MNLQVLTYSIYLIVSIAITIWVAHTLFKNGKIFLVEIFNGNKELAESVDKLLLVGFYLINIGYSIFMLRIDYTIVTYAGMLEILSVKIGTIILILGAMHFFNLFIFFEMRKRAKQNQRTFKTSTDINISEIKL